MRGTRQPSARPRQRGRGEDAGESPLPRRGQRGRERGPGMPRSGGPGPDFPPRAVAAAVRVSQHQGDRVGRPRAEGALTPSYAQRHPRLPRAQRDRVTQRGQDSVQHWRRSPPPRHRNLPTGLKLETKRNTEKTSTGRFWGDAARASGSPTLPDNRGPRAEQEQGG